MIRSELIKARSLPTPFWCGTVALACLLLGALVTWWKGPGPDATALDLAVTFPTFIVAMVFGVWMFGHEYGQNTMRRVLTADPRRGRLILAKLAVTVMVVTLFTAALFLIALPLYNLAATGHDRSIPVELASKMGLAAVLGNLLAAVLGGAVAMITRSMSGGMTITLVFFFVIDSLLLLVPKVEKFTLNGNFTKVTEWITGIDAGIFSGPDHHTVAVSGLIVAGWLIVLLGLGSLRLIRGEVK